MEKIKWVSVILVSVLLLASSGTVFADSEEPIEEPSEDLNSTATTHPIVVLLSNYFGGLFDLLFPPITPEIPVEEEPLPEPVLTTQEQIAAYHDDGMGFGVLVKLFDLVSQAQEQCGLTGEYCDVTVDSLIEKFNSGVGIGELNKMYGKPDHTGVGQIRKELKGNGKGFNKNK